MTESATKDSLSRSRRDLLDLLLKEEGIEHPRDLVSPRTETGDVPLSFAQLRLWFLRNFLAEVAAYNVSIGLRLVGPLDLEALRSSLGEIVRRHESLRTTFPASEGEPRQHVRPPSAFPPIELPVIAVDGEPEALEVARREGHAPFDLESGPLWRFTLLRLSTEEHVLVLAMHHIISDAWSLDIFIRELGILYGAFSQGRPSPLEQLSVQYPDFALWQRERLSGNRLETELSYWTRQLANSPATLDLPTDRPRPTVLSLRGATVSALYPAALRDALKDLSHREGVTLFMTLSAAFFVLLGRYSSQEDLLVGTPIAGRTRQETEGVIGFFVNTLVFRGDLSGDPTFREFLARVREMALGAYANQDLPFEKLVEKIQPNRSLSRNPLFQVMFGLETPVGGSSTFSGLRVSPYRVPRDVAHFDLSVEMGERPDGLGADFEYSTDLFDADTVQGIVTHMEVLLHGIAANPDRRLSDLPLLGEEEKRARVANARGPARDYGNALVHQLFEERAARDRLAVAVQMGEETLTYGELNQRANQLAHTLREAGAGPEAIVGLCLKRSVEAIVSLLGIWKAGAAYVPLDPTYPGERLRLMIEDAAARIVVTSSSERPALPEFPGRLVCLDEERREISAQPVTNPLSIASADNLAVVLFTSGSTGAPKGVLLTHRGLHNRLRWGEELYRIGKSDSVLQIYSLNFDFAIWEFFTALVAGARVVMAPADVPRDPGAVVRLIAENDVTHAGLVPSTMEALLDQADAESCRSLRIVSMGGEALTSKLVERFRAVSDAEIHNGYGPAEASIDVSCWILPEGARPIVIGHTAPIGRPNANTRLHVLGRRMELTPFGAAGELFIGGLGLARGYLNRPDLTAERFVPNPFAGEPGERLYRSGDEVRHRADGNLEFLGRTDDQVKIRGYRVEPGEVERMLETHPRVAECVVVAREDSLGAKRLVAYVVGARDSAPQATALRDFLQERLPSYMIPAAFLTLDCLPRLAHGKVNRGALPEPDGLGADRNAAFAAPRSAVEDVLSLIFAQTLRRDRVGVTDDFFELGGHSLLAAQLISRVRTSLGIEIPIRLLFEFPTVAGLARQVVLARHAPGTGAALPPLSPVPRDGDVPLSFAQQRLWFLEQLEPGGVSYNVPWAIRMSGRLDVEAMRKSLEAVVSRHESLRTTFVSRNGQPVQIVGPPGSSPLETVDISARPLPDREAEAERLAVEEAQRPFDLEKGPLIRVRLVKLDASDHLLLLTTHHIVSDAWSLDLLFRELAASYAGLCGKRDVSLPDLPVQYPDYAMWQRGWLSGRVFEQQLAYWTEQLVSTPRLLELPTDRPRPVVRTGRGARVGVTWDQTFAKSVRSFSRSEGATLFMTLLAAFQALLHRYTGEEDVLVGTPAANRRPEGEGLIGFLVNTLVMRADVSGDPTFREFLGRVRKVALGAYTHQDLPFEKLVEVLRPERDLSHTPLFQVMFAFQNAPLQSVEFPGLKLRPVAVHTGTAKFDLTLDLFETEEGLRGELEYSTDLFDGERMERLLGHLRSLLEGAIQNPEERLSRLPLLTGSEREQILVEFNRTQISYPAACVHRLFERQVERAPDSVAVEFGKERLSYRQLNARSNALAQRLRGLGVGPDVLVGICMERSVEMVISLLGVLKAGGAYLPLDPAYPQERLSVMLQDAKPAVLLTQEKHLQSVTPSATPTLCIEDDETETDAGIAHNPNVPVGLDNLAYVMYTSGSTGVPKGVLIPHRAVIRLLIGVDYAELDGKTVVSHLSPISFDASTFEIWGSLLHGGRCVLFPDRVSTPAELGDEIQAKKVTTSWLTASLFNTMIDTNAEALSGIRQLLIGGEALSVAHVRRAMELLPRTQIINGYGPTETTTFACCHLIRKDGDTLRSSIPIGRPIANTQVYVLDAWGAPVPVGVFGEQYIGGDGLARGYLNRPELTAERFVPNPYSSRPGERLFRSGDVTRFLSDGNLEFFGRTDHQVKIRGFRIEPGEVESALRQHRAVKEAVVVAREDQPGEKRLVAYVVGFAKHLPDQGELRDFLRSRLPHYMIPGAFVALDSLPLLATGKLDRRSLPAPEKTTPKSESFARPRDPVEQQLVMIWEQILGTGPIAVTDNFFDLGGHSLLAARLFAEIKKRLDKNLPLATLFQAPTVEQLASVMRREGWIPPWSALVPINSGGSRPPFYCVHAVGGNVLTYMDLARHMGPDQPVYGLQAKGLDGQQQPHSTIQHMAEHYVDEILRIQPEGPYHMGGSSAGGIVAYEMAQQLAARGKTVGVVALFDTWGPDYGRPLPGMSAARLRLLHFVERVDLHLGNFLVTEGARAKLAYIRTKSRRLKANLRQIAQRRWRKLKKLVDDLVNPLPDALRKVESASLRATALYQPKPYPGRLTVFRASKQPAGIYPDPELGWGEVALGGVDVYEVPGYHGAIVYEPRIRILAEELRICLRRFEETAVLPSRRSKAESVTELARDQAS